eukprot:COSAG05_NODE_1811_length_4037_cov_2.956323_1_plen_51_part_00
MHVHHHGQTVHWHKQTLLQLYHDLLLCCQLRGLHNPLARDRIVDLRMHSY